MPSVTEPIPLIPPLRAAVERFLARSRFAARTRDSYAQDLAPLLDRVGAHPVPAALTRAAAASYLAAQDQTCVAIDATAFVTLGPGFDATCWRRRH